MAVYLFFSPSLSAFNTFGVLKRETMVFGYPFIYGLKKRYRELPRYRLSRSRTNTELFGMTTGTNPPSANMREWTVSPFVFSPFLLPPPPFSSSTSVLLPRYNELKPRIFHSTGTIHIMEVPACALSNILPIPREKHPVGDLIRGCSRSFRRRKKNYRFPLQRNRGDIALQTLASFVSAILCI